MTPEQRQHEALLVHRAQRGDRDALTELLHKYEGLLWSAAANVPSGAVSVQEAFQDAALAFCQHVHSFDADAGSSFSAYISRCVKGEVINEVHKYTSGFKVPHAYASTYWSAMRETESLEEAEQQCVSKGMSRWAFVSIHNALTGMYFIDSESEARGEDDYSGEDIYSAPFEALLPFEWDNSPDLSVWEAVETLSEKQQEAVLLFARGLSSVEIGRRLGISQAAAHQRVTNGLQNLRDLYRNDA